MLKKKKTYFFFFFEKEKERKGEGGDGGRAEKVAERGKRGGLAATVERGLPPGGQFCFGSMFLSGRGQHLFPLFSIIQNKY